MRINEKTGKPFGYHVKGKKTLLEFCIEDELKNSIEIREFIASNMQNRIDAFLNPQVVYNDLMLRQFVMLNELDEIAISKLNEKISFYNWMLQ